MSQNLSKPYIEVSYNELGNFWVVYLYREKAKVYAQPVHMVFVNNPNFIERLFNVSIQDKIDRVVDKLRKRYEKETSCDIANPEELAKMLTEGYNL